MAVKFTTYGGLSMRIERSDGFIILVDPFITGNVHATIEPKELYDADLILLSHSAYDHFGDTVEILRNSHAMVYCDDSSVKKLIDAGVYDPSRVMVGCYGDVRKFGITTMRVMKAWHASYLFAEDGSFLYAPPYGFILQVEPGVTYYAPGDTAIYSDMKLINELYHPNVASVGISSVAEGACREKDIREAALEVLWLGADVVFPGHYLPDSEDLEHFQDAMKEINPQVTIALEMNRPYIYKPYEFGLE